MMQAD
jgi:hypothetical protein